MLVLSLTAGSGYTVEPGGSNATLTINDNDPPGNVTLIYPDTLDTPDANAAIIFQWSATGVGITYELTVDTTGSSDGIVYLADLAGTTHSVPAYTLTQAESYTWNVVATNAAGSTSPAAKVTFTTMADVTPPTAGVVGGDIDIDETITVRFSEKIQSAPLVTEVSFTLVGGGADLVSGVDLQLDGLTIVVTLSETLDYSTSYTLTITDSYGLQLLTSNADISLWGKKGPHDESVEAVGQTQFGRSCRGRQTRA